RIASNKTGPRFRSILCRARARHFENFTSILDKKVLPRFASAVDRLEQMKNNTGPKGPVLRRVERSQGSIVEQPRALRYLRLAHREALHDVIAIEQNHQLLLGAAGTRAKQVHDRNKVHSVSRYVGELVVPDFQ